MKTALSLFALSLSALPTSAFAQETPAATGHTIYFWRENAELDTMPVSEITLLKLATISFKRPNKTQTTRQQLYEFEGIDFSTTPSSVRLNAAKIGKLASAPVSERLAALMKASSEVETDLGKITDPFGKAVTELALARICRDLAALSSDAERNAQADRGLSAIAPILADQDSWFFIQGSELAVDLHIVKDNAKEALNVAKALVDAADAAGDPAKLLRVQARLLHARAALAADAAATARDTAKEASEFAVGDRAFFESKKDMAGVIKRLEVLERRAQIFQGYGILAQNPKQAQGYFKSILDKVPQAPEARRQKEGDPKRVLNSESYDQGLWPGSELWSYATLGRAEADYLVAKEANRKPDMEGAIEGFFQGLAVAPELPELLARAKVRLAECLMDSRGKNAETLAKSYYREVAEYHPTSAAAKTARAKR